MFLKAEEISSLLHEFNRRDSIKLTPDNGNIINYLKVLKFPYEHVITIEALKTSPYESFLLKTQSDLICAGSFQSPNLSCKNIYGFSPIQWSGKDIFLDNHEESSLLLEFEKRNSIVLSVAQKNILNFLYSLKFQIENIQLFEIISQVEGKESFILKTMSDMICLGSLEQQMLRCKNSMGITGISYQGDAD
jgi:hypothetical protein